MNLSGAHGGFESGEAVVEGAENGDHAVGDCLTLLQRLPYGCSSRLQALHRLRDPHRSLSGKLPPQFAITSTNEMNGEICDE